MLDDKGVVVVYKRALAIAIRGFKSGGQIKIGKTSGAVVEASQVGVDLKGGGQIVSPGVAGGVEEGSQRK